MAMAALLDFLPNLNSSLNDSIKSITELYAFPRKYPAEIVVQRIKCHFLIRRITGDLYPSEGFIVPAYSDIVTHTACVLSLAVIGLRLSQPAIYYSSLNWNTTF